ncbi:MAG: hypothetical protein LUQ50_10575 [Methanospirillum sp.]|uniref:hypothetical protein n=1 Tax=Methanospirillum sp. TaxID=45200 RepID=UPI00236EB32B|nr:hypothetical protein [Methanospirillum sp.]MDD1729500.1 hypothetical protein [Methanospirillum sp.]
MHSTKAVMLVLLILSLMFVGIGTATETSVFPVPVQTIQPPVNLSIGVQVDQMGSQINATFRGGFGQNLLKSLQITVTSPDGTSQTQNLGWETGNTVTFTGTGCGDQVTGTAVYMDGVEYPFLNEMMSSVSGICSADFREVTDPCAEIAASPSLKPDPIEEIPANKSVIIQANVDIRTINVEFRGGFGQNLIKSLKVSRYAPDGAIDIKDLGNTVGSTVSFEASNNCLDRIGADVSFMDGTQYHFYDQVLHISRTH